MRRDRVVVRDDWIARLEAIGFHIWRHRDGRPYWREDACFVLNSEEVEILHEAAEDAVAMVDEAVARAFDEDRLATLGIHGVLAEAARASWARKAASLYGRFDFAWDGRHPPKLLEYNADTPTALFEAAVVQWRWLIDHDPAADQYNSIHEALLGAWADLRPAIGDDVHFACMLDDPDDTLTTDYLRDCAVQAGLRTTLLDVADIGLKDGQFIDGADAPISTLFKLYPWEWMAEERFGAALAASEMTVIEPAWRCVASSKALLADLSEMFDGHPIILPTSRDAADVRGPVMEKAFFGREGADVRLRRFTTPPTAQPVVYQQRTAMPKFDGGYPVFGVWVVAGAPCGLGIREDENAITGPNACFVPHRIG
jgi:glutathionylspermidine synthase